MAKPCWYFWSRFSCSWSWCRWPRRLSRGQLFGWYVVTTLVAILLYVSSTEAFLEEFVVPLRRILLARTAITKPLRLVIFIGLPLLLGWYFRRAFWFQHNHQPARDLLNAALMMSKETLNLKKWRPPRRADVTRPAEQTDDDQLSIIALFVIHSERMEVFAIQQVSPR